MITIDGKRLTPKKAARIMLLDWMQRYAEFSSDEEIMERATNGEKETVRQMVEQEIERLSRQWGMETQ